ncbi:MAG: TlpA disulfide reductase family protein [Desulfobacterales bacterium]
MKPMRKIVWVLLITVALGSVGLAFLQIDLFAGTENQELERLFNEIGIVQIPPAADPVEIQLKDQNGRPTSFSEFRGKIVFINFWASWCMACVIEMPSMEKLHQKFKDKDFVMVGINLQESEATILKFYKEHKLTFTTLLDSTGDVGTAFRILGIPTTFILDKNGIIIGKALGPREWDSRDSFALFEYLTDSYVAGANSKSIQ